MKIDNTKFWSWNDAPAGFDGANASRQVWPGQSALTRDSGKGVAHTGSLLPRDGSKALPEDAIALVPMRNMVLFPGVIAPLSLGREASVLAAREAVHAGRRVGFLLQRNPSEDAPTPEGLHWVGTSGQIVQHVNGPDGSHHVVVQGEARFRVLEFLDGWPFLVARVAYIEDAAPKGIPEFEARFLQLRSQAAEAAQLLPNVPDELANAIRAMDSPGGLADMVANFLDIKLSDKQSLLETFDLTQRVDRVLALLSERVGVLRLSRSIGEQTQKAFDERQREHVLREQMRQIQKELGDGEDTAAELEDLKKAIDEAGMPDDTLKHAKKELKRLQRMSDGAGEASMLRTYLEWLTELPWKAEDQAVIDIDAARRVLDEDHFGLEKIKRRILEHLAVRKLNPTGKSPILCFVGPPGVGKTSLGHSIAKAMGRKFQRVALGGVHDEAEIRGHRRTYIGSMPGNIISALRRAGSRSGVFLLDEIDKLGAGGFHGDPASAMLEVLDPEQNAKFRDNYLGVDFDLSKIMFIATANVLDTIPGPLRDRMEIIQLPGYTEAEKLQIAKRYLIARQLDANGLKEADASIDDTALGELIAGYTREAGVRNLEREIGAVLRHVAMRVASNTEKVLDPIRIAVEDLDGIVGARKFDNEVALRKGMPGVATGLAWTPVGGDILFIEATQVPGSGKLILTGQLGDVMKESAQAALTLAKSMTGRSLEKIDLHVHVPAGATPKDGPSAGVAMFLSMVSLLTGKAVRSDVAMTGEISLRGLVMPIGGVKEKVLAALRAGITTVMLPARNRKDLDDVPADAKEKLRFVFLERVDQALQEAVGLSAEDLRLNNSIIGLNNSIIEPALPA
ncbi:MAG: endopeptidase La [Burkholderiales bacterium]